MEVLKMRLVAWSLKGQNRLRRGLTLTAVCGELWHCGDGPFSTPCDISGAPAGAALGTARLERHIRHLVRRWHRAAARQRAHRRRRQLEARRVGGQLHWLPRARALPQPVSEGRHARSALGSSGSATLLLLAPHRLYERERHCVGLARQWRTYRFKAGHPSS